MFDNNSRERAQSENQARLAVVFVVVLVVVVGAVLVLARRDFGSRLTPEEKKQGLELEEKPLVKPSPRLEVLSGNLIPIQGEKSQEVQGLRVLGETRNVGKVRVVDAEVIIQMFDKGGEVIATKVGEWNDGFSFLPLEPGESGLYDVVVSGKVPEAFERASVQLRGKSREDSVSFVQEKYLKIKERRLESKQVQQKGRTVNYYMLTGQLVNTSQSTEILAPSIYVWLKNKEGRVIGFASKKYQSDLLVPGQELGVKLNVIPLAKGYDSYEVRVFGKEF